MKHSAGREIAVIGGGIAGLTAAYLLHADYHVTLFEKSERLGGNAYTLKTPEGEDVDIAAAVFGKLSYKNTFKLFARLNIETVSSFPISPFAKSGLGASFYNLDTKKGIFLTLALKGLLSQKFDILKPDHLTAMADLTRGLNKAQQLLKRGELEGISVEEALKKIPELRGEAQLVFVCFLCLISSMHCNAVLDAPARFFIEKLKVYHDFMPPKALFSVSLTSQRTKCYVDALSEAYRDSIVLNSRIRTVKRQARQVLLCMEDGREILFDKVVFACNADQAVELLSEPTSEEKRLLGAWKYTDGKIIVHSDDSHFPRRELMEGYTFLYKQQGRFIETSVSGSLWSLPGVSKKCNLISTQHPNFPVEKDKILTEKIFRTPSFDFNSCSTIADLPSLNGRNNTYYCGSHFGFGLHEDAISSAVAVACLLGVDF